MLLVHKFCGLALVSVGVRDCVVAGGRFVRFDFDNFPINVVSDVDATWRVTTVVSIAVVIMLSCLTLIP